jgi:hypothetical protein
MEKLSEREWKTGMLDLIILVTSYSIHLATIANKYGLRLLNILIFAAGRECDERLPDARDRAEAGTGVELKNHRHRMSFRTQLGSYLLVRCIAATGTGALSELASTSLARSPRPSYRLPAGVDKLDTN